MIRPMSSARLTQAERAVPGFPSAMAAVSVSKYASRSTWLSKYTGQNDGGMSVSEALIAARSRGPAYSSLTVLR
jgi:hypothetical protein